MSEQGDRWEERDQQDQGARSSEQGTGESGQGGKWSDRLHRITPDIRENAEPGAGPSLRHSLCEDSASPAPGGQDSPPTCTNVGRAENLRPAFSLHSAPKCKKILRPGAARSSRQ